MNGAEICVRCLIEEKIKYIFGYPGAAIAPFYDALRKSSAENPDVTPRHVLVRNEQNAGHAASGYARTSGTVGVCCATSGPGALNLMPAIAAAYMDSIPVIAITGQVPTGLIGRDVFQEADITGACEPFTKYSYLVKDADKLPKIFKDAFYIASSGRPGPVLIDLPLDIQLAEYKKTFSYPEKVNIVSYKPRTQGHPLQIKRAVAGIAESERPLICAGGGVVSAKARRELIAFAEKLGIPVVSTLMGVGIMPTDHPLYLGMLGTHGRRAANLAAADADLLILCGARVGDRSLAAPDQTAAHAKIIHIDIDTVEIGKNMSADIPIVGDVRLILRELAAKSDCIGNGQVPGSASDNAERLPEVTDNTERHREWADKCLEWKEQTGAVYAAPRQGYIDPAGFMLRLSVLMSRRGKAVVVADVGQNQMWAANSFDFVGGRFLTSGGMGTMGYSVPAAIGAKLAKPERQIIAVCGDGSFQMMLPELSTIVQEKLAVKIIIMRNGVLGMVREIQDIKYGGRHYAVDLKGYPDIARLAGAYGIEARTLSDSAAADSAIDWLLSADEAAILECSVDPDAASRL